MEEKAFYFDYIVNEEKKTVTAVMLVDIEELGNSYGEILEITCNAGFSPKFVGVARCKPNDAWDIERGKRVAKFKAKKSFYKFVRRAAKHLEKQVQFMLGKVHKDIGRLDNEVNKLETLIKSM